jgi:DNA-binding GntR family transcriptional regulator
VDAIRDGDGEMAAARMAAHLQHASEVVTDFARHAQHD